MKYRKTGSQYVVVLARGEEFVATFTRWCVEQGIQSAFFHGLGAVERVQLGYYTVPTKEYHFRDEPAAFEVASLNGNVALVDGEPFAHAHAVLASCDESHRIIAGHIKQMYVAATLEIFVTPFETQMTRSPDDETGLKLLDL